jgi:hypothetical protein
VTVSSRLVRFFVILVPAWLAGCGATPLEPYVPAHCHGSAAPFERYILEYQDVPGFIFEVIDTSLRSALARQGLKEADAPPGDIRVVSTLELIDHNPPREAPVSIADATDNFDDPMGRPSRDPFGETVAPNELNRFVTHFMVDIYDQRTGTLIWKGSIDRAHAIQGGETFHDARAVLQISQAFDQMFVGLTTPCE